MLRALSQSHRRPVGRTRIAARRLNTLRRWPRSNRPRGATVAQPCRRAGACHHRRRRPRGGGHRRAGFIPPGGRRRPSVEAGILGLTAGADVGGGGAGLRAAADVVERLAGACGSTAMVVLMHYAATARASRPTARRRSARRSRAGRHLTTLAFSEAGSRSHFWAPLRARPPPAGDGSRASTPTRAGSPPRAEADSYVWSSRPSPPSGPDDAVARAVRRRRARASPAGFDGLGLRGNGSTPVTADGVARPGSTPCSAPTAPASTSPWPSPCPGSWS